MRSGVAIGASARPRLRRVCRAFHRWGTAALAALPRVVVVGGFDSDEGELAGVEVLDLSTLRWSSSGVVPALPEPRRGHSTCAFGDGRVVVAGGADEEDRDLRTAWQWVPGTAGWVPLPDMAEGRANAAAAPLPDGRW